MALPRLTNREEMEALLSKQGPLGGERLIRYNIFLTDAFSLRSFGTAQFLDAPGPPDQIDGFQNDDSYRRSRHLSRTLVSSTQAGESNLRENSLARQLQEKRDQPATIRLIRRLRPEELALTRLGTTLGLIEPGVPWVNLIPPNTKFFLEQVQENREEKVQVIDTFGEWVAFFFGRKPEIYSYGGTLLNAQNHDWKNEFHENYDNFLRGSKAVQNKATIILQYDDVLVEGYMLNCSISMTGMMDKAVPFQFNMLVMSRSPLNPRAILGLRALRSGSSSAEQALFNDMNEALDLTKEGAVDDLETFLLMREYFSGNYVPGAGLVINRPETNQLEAPVSTEPGANAGAPGADSLPRSFGFEPTTTRLIRQANETEFLNLNILGLE